MAYLKERKVTILQKIKNSPFVKMNNEVYGGTSRELAASESAEKTLLANDDLLKNLLPTVLGLDSKSGKWQDVVSNYFYAISIDVPKGGKILNTSLSFDLEDSAKIVEIQKLIKAKKAKISTDEELAEFVMGYSVKGNKNVNEVDYYKYATPVNKLEYFNYLYCLHHNRVANSQALVNKSPRIEFYMVTKEDIVEAKRLKFETTKRINRALLKLDEDKELFDAVCSVLNITTGDEIDKGIKISEVARTNPEKIITAMNDKNLMTKSLIESYIRKGILKRNPSSSMIIDANDPTVIIGTNMETALTFFSDAKNDGALNQYSARAKSLI